PVALPGANLPNGLKIKVSKLRGVESQGMLCSPSELKLSEDSDGLLILSPDAKVGEPFGSLVRPDTILDVEITPNRGDLLSHFGLAREIAALTGNVVAADVLIGSLPPETAAATIRISAPRECPFYSLRRIDNVKVGPSPDWLRAKLEAAGMRSINNIVDISNFVMLEMGQPTHAFDADKIKGSIHVRLAREDEEFLALDGKTYSLTARDLVIADDERIVGIGGVMGGEDSGVTESTRNILLEAAYFLPASIRRTARNLNLPSDASYRFERGVDPMAILPASQRATDLMREIAGGSPAKLTKATGELPASPSDVSLRYHRSNELLGIEVAPEEVDRILQGFGLTKSETIVDGMNWKIPSYRADLRREVDLIEEVIRAHGVDKVPVADRSRFTSLSDADRAADFENSVRARLVSLGLFEARTSSLIPRHAIASENGAVELRNPLSEDHVALRPSLVRGLLDVLARNLNMGANSVRLFELGAIFMPPDAKEKRVLGFVFAGAAATQPHWRGGAKRQLDFFDLKGAIDSVRIRDLSFRRAENSSYALAAEILSGKSVIGFAGQLSSGQAAGIGARAPVFVAQVELDSLVSLGHEDKSFAEIERFPSVTRDIAMMVPEKLSHTEIMRTIFAAKESLLSEVQLFDIFQDKNAIDVGLKSMAYTLTYRDKNRTLTNDEVTVVHGRIREKLRSELGAELRE
ncbi:MAG: phenylalanine--tRNA ligase subunit beta, partial [Chthoniobacterales bacterium]